MYYYGYNGCSGMNTGNYGYQPTYVGNTTGGYSGSAVLPVAVRMVYQVYKAVKIPIIGMVFNSIDIFFVRLPMFYTCTLVGLVVGLFALIMSLICLIGKRPIIPVISDIIKSNFGD